MRREYEVIEKSENVGKIETIRLKNYCGTAKNIKDFVGMNYYLNCYAVFRIKREDDEDYTSMVMELVNASDESCEFDYCCTSSPTVIEDISEIYGLMKECGEKVAFKINSFPSKNNSGSYYRALV